MTSQKIPKSEDIWKSYFLCRFHTLSDMSKDYLKIFGVNVTGIDEYDEDLTREWTTTYLNIDQMIDKYRRRVPIKIIKSQDAILVYDIIQRHVNVWRNKIGNSLNISNAPYKDLEDLDAFAQTLFPKVTEKRPYLTPSEANSTFAKMFINPYGLNYRKKQMIEKNRREQEEMPERESMAEFFREKMAIVDAWKNESS
jgi:hypothetical protein